MQWISMHRIGMQLVLHHWKSLQRFYRALMIVNDQYKNNLTLISPTIFLRRKRVDRKRRRFLKKLHWFIAQNCEQLTAPHVWRVISPEAYEVGVELEANGTQVSLLRRWDNGSINMINGRHISDKPEYPTMDCACEFNRVRLV